MKNKPKTGGGNGPDQKKKGKGKGKPVSGLMAGLVNAGFLTEKSARKIRREQREDVRDLKKQHGHEAVEEQQRSRQAALEDAKRQHRAREARSMKVAEQRDAATRITDLLRHRVNASGQRQFFFVRDDRVIDFIEVDDQALRRLGDGALAVVRGPAARPGDYMLFVNDARLHELRTLAPELVLFPKQRKQPAM